MIKFITESFLIAFWGTLAILKLLLGGLCLLIFFAFLWFFLEMVTGIN